MHIWPSMRIRDSFKVAYLTKTEQNLRRMSSDKNYDPNHSSSPSLNPAPRNNNGNHHLEERLLPEKKNASRSDKAGIVVRELVMALSCCYCCFGCGACLDEEVE